MRRGESFRGWRRMWWVGVLYRERLRRGVVMVDGMLLVEEGAQTGRY